jgi:hypothetical protein
MYILNFQWVHLNKDSLKRENTKDFKEIPEKDREDCETSDSRVMGWITL